MRMSHAAENYPTSGIRAMFDRAGQYDDVVNLCLGEPGPTTPDDIIKVAVDGLLARKTKYQPNLGILPLRVAIAEKMARENNVRLDPEREILVTIGATEALMLTLLTLVNPGDEVIIPDPAWPNYRGQVMMVNATPIPARLTEANGFKMTADIIEPLLTNRTRLIMLNSPSNPTGGILEADDLEKIAKLVARHGVYVISDEPYEKLIYDRFKHISLAAFPEMDKHVITINSFSKTYAMTGWRVGYACANPTIIANMVKLHENVCSCVNEAFQLAAVYALQHGEPDVQMMKQAYEVNRNYLVEALNRMNGVHCMMPPATFYAFPNITGLGMTSQAVSDLILDRCHVVTSPGSAFGMAGEGFIRISFASNLESIQEGVRRMADLFGQRLPTQVERKALGVPAMQL